MPNLTRVGGVDVFGMGAAKLAAELGLPDAGLLATSRAELVEATRRVLGDPVLARELGTAGGAHALQRFGLGRFLAEWDALLREVAR